MADEMVLRSHDVERGCLEAQFAHAVRTITAARDAAGALAFLDRVRRTLDSGHHVSFTRRSRR